MMLVPFVIDVNSLTPDMAWTPSDIDNHFRSLLRVWQRYGFLHHDGTSFAESKLKEAIDKLPPLKIRSDLKALLLRSPMRACNDEWNRKPIRLREQDDSLRDLQPKAG